MSAKSEFSEFDPAIAEYRLQHRELEVARKAYERECARRRPILEAWQRLDVPPWAFPNQNYEAGFRRWASECSRHIKAFAVAVRKGDRERPKRMLELVTGTDPAHDLDERMVAGERAAWSLVILAITSKAEVVAEQILKFPPPLSSLPSTVPWWETFQAADLPVNFFEDDPRKCPRCGDPWPTQQFIDGVCGDPCSGRTTPGKFSQLTDAQLKLAREIYRTGPHTKLGDLRLQFKKQFGKCSSDTAHLAMQIMREEGLCQVPVRISKKRS